jgi:hypothetical protein
MNKGMQAVPQPQEYEYLRKGLSSPAQAQYEILLHSTRVTKLFTGKDDAAGSVLTFSSYFECLSHALAERLCYWPTFPSAWNSDCGQPRREDGIGAQAPQDWQASGPVVQGEVFANECTQHSHPTLAQWRSMLLWCALHIAIAVAILVVPIALAVQASGR